MEILHRDDLPLGGFAGLPEHRLAMGSKVYGDRREPGTWNGIGSFVYLADARFLPKGKTRLHSNRAIDVISVMVEGRITHEGSLEHGREMIDTDVQVQRAGGNGFSHNEVNPDDTENRMIQLCVLPERSGEPAGIIDAFDDPTFKAAVERTNPKKLIMAALLTKVCVIYPALRHLAKIKIPALLVYGSVFLCCAKGYIARYARLGAP